MKNPQKSIAAQVLALSLSLLLPLPGFAHNAARQAPVVGVASIGTLRLPVSAAPQIGIPSAALIPAVNGAGLDSALDKAQLPASVQAVVRSPAIDVLNKIQEKGIKLGEIAVNHQDAAKLRAAAEAMPDGALRREMFALANAAQLSGAGGGAGAASKAFNQVYDYSAPTAGESVWTKISRWPFIPSGLSKSFAARGERNRTPSEPGNKAELEVPLAKLRWVPPVNQLPASTKDIEHKADKQIVGQDRAMTSIYWGVKMPGDNYNLYVSGPEGSGRETAVKAVLDKFAAEMPTSPDLVAVTNFADTSVPLYMELPPGMGVKMESSVEEFVKLYQMNLPRVLDSAEQNAARRAVKEEFEAGVAQNRANFDQAVGETRVGAFGVKLVVEGAGEQATVKVVSTYRDIATGEVKAVTNDAEVDALVAAGAFTKSEWEAAQEQLKKSVPDQLLELYKMVQAQGSDEQKAQVDAMIAQISAGKFGIKLIEQQDGEGNVSLQVAPTYFDPVSKTMKTVESKEQLDRLISDKVFTQAEWDDAIARSGPVAKPFFELYEQMMRGNMQSAEAANEKINELNGEAAAALVQKLAPKLLASVAPSLESAPGMEAFKDKLMERQKAFNAEVAKIKLKNGMGLAMVPTGQGGMTVILTKEAGGKRVQVPEDEISPEIMAEAKKHLPKINQLFSAMMTENKQDAEALKKSIPAPGPMETRAKSYLATLLKHATANWAVFLPQDQESEKKQKFDASELYVVNVLRDRAGVKGGKVVYAQSPTFEEFFGAADSKKIILMPGIGAVRAGRPGGPIIKGGLYVDADVIVLNVMDALKEPGLWPALMQMRRNGTADFFEDGLAGLASARGGRYQVAHRPKIVLIGSPTIRMLLRQHDEDFARSFNATAEFEPSLSNGEESIEGYKQFMKKVILKSKGTKEEVLDMTRDAMSALLEYAARAAGSNTKLSAQFGALYSLMRESTFWAKESGRNEVRREDVETALERRRDSEQVYQSRFKELLTERVFNVETSGEAVGQVNGLAVMGSFGVPMRITVIATAGQPGLVSVDREARTTGTSFNKALGVVEGFLQHTFAQKKAISAQIRISFEQEYSGIDGDSATSTEIYGVLSRLANAPIKQQYAITGSADQFGNVQAIGGVNEKIEGYFELVKHRGFEGAPGEPPGVLIPKANVGDLMLKPEIVQAVREGKFKIFAIEHVSQGIEILTGQSYMDILRKADARLAELRRNK